MEKSAENNTVMGMSEQNIAMLQKTLGAALALGGGGGLAAAIVNYINHLNRADDTNKDDDTLYVYKKPVPGMKKKADLGAVGAAGLDTLILALGPVGAYALVNKLYSKFRKRQAQKELDDAQKIFVETQGYTPVEKKAAADPVVPSSPGTAMRIGSLPLPVAVLLALAGGGAAWTYLDHSFPAKKKKVTAPKRIEIIDDPNIAEEDREKIASVCDSLESSDACEFLVRTVLAEKKANSNIRNIVNSVANYGPKQFNTAVASTSFNDSLDLVKGASAHTPHPFAEHAATVYVTKAAHLTDLVGLTAAAEFAESHPDIMLAVGAMNDEQRECLSKIAAVLGQAYRAELAAEFEIGCPDESLTKQAFSEGAFTDLTEAVTSGLSDMANSKNEDAEDGEDKSKKNKVKFILNGKSSRRALHGLPEADIIDKILSPSSEG